jgi:uncharacterized protein YndB with AHSA1/START domain
MAEPIVVELALPVSREAVWRAVTVPELMRQWYFEAMGDFRPEVGFETSFEVESGGRVFRHLWEVTEVVPGQVVTYTWRYDGYSGLGSTEWRLLETPDGTQLVLACTGIESFPQEIPELTRESCQAGWEYFIRNRLRAFLESGGSQPDDA